MTQSDDGCTLVVERDGDRVVEVPIFGAHVVEGPDAGRRADSVDGRLLIGSADGADLVLTDPTVSRFHLELEATPRGLMARDLGSTNGSFAGRLRLGEVILRDPVTRLRVGRSRLEVAMGSARATRPTPRATAFGALVGSAPSMRETFGRLERAAQTTTPVLLAGETGTGKELAARALHDASPRRAGAFEVVDCGGMPATLIESELFGHTRGAFTGATSERDGAFARADGGTVFLDELGELPLALQPKLLRVLAEGEVRPVGGDALQKVDVRVVAATNRDLRREVNQGRFRADLYYRLAVVEVRMPPLRERLDDLDVLVPTLLAQIAAQRGLDVHLETGPELIATLRANDWPGNVRELRNYLEHLLVFQLPPTVFNGAVSNGAVSKGASPGVDALVDGLDALPWRDAKRHVTERFERHYLAALLAATDGNVAEAARRAGVDRGTLFRSMRRLGIRDHD